MHTIKKSPFADINDEWKQTELTVESLEMFEDLCEEAKEEAEENDEERPFNLQFVLIFLMSFHSFQSHMLRKRIYTQHGAERKRNIWSNSTNTYSGNHMIPKKKSSEKAS
jgi:hypothetical protein